MINGRDTSFDINNVNVLSAILYEFTLCILRQFIRIKCSRTYHDVSSSSLFESQKHAFPNHLQKSKSGPTTILKDKNGVD